MRWNRLACGLLVAAAAARPTWAAEGGGGSSLIEPHIGTIFWTLITFFLLVLLLGRFAWKPLLGALELRENSIKSSIDQAEHHREEAQALLRQHQELLAQARRERAEAVAAGQRDAETLKAEILDEARAQREQLLRQTETQVAASMRQARAELRGEVVGLAIGAAEKLLVRNLDDPTQRRLVEDYLRDMERN